MQSLGLLATSEKQHLEHGDDVAPRNVQIYSRTRKAIRFLTGVVLFVGFLVLGLFVSFRLSNTQDSHQTVLHNPCGNTVAEAKAHGCEWDVLSFCWLPEQCLDRELTQSFRDAGPWVFYGDRNKTVTISEEAFGENKQTVYLTNELHAAHCAFTWLKFHRALTAGNMIHAQLDMTHTEHCSHVI